MKRAKTQGERQDAYRAQGRQIAVVLRDPKAIAALDRLTGRADIEAVLDTLFARFCIGK